jgi:hypothetical protein
MPYVIRRTDGNVQLIIQDGLVDTSLGIALVGRSYTNYGESIANNFVKLLENFSNDVPPPNPLDGQLWYDKSSTKLKLWKHNSWDVISDRGPIGFTGSKGDIGPIGIEGPAGYTGSVGIGFTGSQGNAGDVGPAGPTGPTGQQGPVGFTGSQGTIGNDSVVPGPIGFTGSRGLSGPAGPTGFTGSRGATGPQGPAGPAGPAGGPIGFTGSQGLPGIVRNWELIEQFNNIDFSNTIIQTVSMLNSLSFYSLIYKDIFVKFRLNGTFTVTLPINGIDNNDIFGMEKGSIDTSDANYLVYWDNISQPSMSIRIPSQSDIIGSLLIYAR